MNVLKAEFEAVIGLEVHCQLATQSKIFCSCPVLRGVSAGPNTYLCPICAGHPGALPMLNQKVVEYAVMAGLATGCTIQNESVFARKNYFYPDLPKGYQISQYDRPICEWGKVNFRTSEGLQSVAIRRIHLEEDAGKSLHRSECSWLDLNRAGVPLIEIVTEPDLHSSEAAGAYLRALYSIVTFLGICEGRMEEGNFRCDANVSVKFKKDSVLGTRVEIKNINSFKFVEKAIDYEIQRQMDRIQSGASVIQETRTYDADRGVTLSMRSKEEAADYRYFPDPDLVPIRLSPSWIEELRKNLPESPHSKQERWMREWALTEQEVQGLTSDRVFCHFYEESVPSDHSELWAKPVANWMMGEVTRLLNESGLTLQQCALKPIHLTDVVRLVHDQTLSHASAKQAIQIAWKTGEMIDAIVDAHALRQMKDGSAVEAILVDIIAKFPKQVDEYRSGKEKILGFLIGQAMKQVAQQNWGGQVSPTWMGELLRKKLSS